jgi:hypothetical protein
MKQKTLLKTALLLLALAGSTNTVWADEVNVSTSSEFGTAYNAAATTATDGGSTTIILATGTYQLSESGLRWSQMEIPMSRTVTIKAAEGADVTLIGKVQSYEANRCGSLIFDGIKLRTTTTNGFIDLGNNTTNVGDIIFRNCDFASVTGNALDRCFITGGKNTGTINSIQFDNCTIHDCSSSYNFIWTEHVVKAISVTNCTLYNYGGESFFYARTANTEQAFSFTFTNNTVYRWAKVNSRRAFAMVGSNYSSGSTYTVKDNIIDGFMTDGTNAYVENMTVNNDNFVLVQTGSGGTIDIENNILLGFKNGDGSNKNNVVWATGGPTITNTNYWPWDATLNDTFGFTSIPFTDAANGDFTINLNSYPAFATASTVGTPLGAPSTWKYTWNSGTAKAGTLILPYEANIPDGITAYTLTYTSGSAATATEITTGILPANTPVLLNAETASNNYYFTATGTVPNAGPADLQKGALTGVYAAGYVATNNYILQDGDDGLGFYKVTADNTIGIGAYRAYLTPGQNAEAPMISIIFNDDMTTGIGNLTPAISKGEGVAYNLAGQRVANGYKGLAIKNGKKYIIK